MGPCHLAGRSLGEALRRLLYCSEWIQSHALHIHLLHAPDSLGHNSGIPLPITNSFQSIVARAVEIVAACEEAIRLVTEQADKPITPCRIDFQPREATGCHATEAPRGILYHRYEIGSDGLVTGALIVPPTSQNQGQVEADLKDMLPGVLDDADDAVRHRCEHLIRNYDPCISCATHFLKLEIERVPAG